MRKSMKKRMLCLLMAAVMVVLATGCDRKIPLHRAERKVLLPMKHRRRNRQ